MDLNMVRQSAPSAAYKRFISTSNRDQLIQCAWPWFIADEGAPEVEQSLGERRRFRELDRLRDEADGSVEENAEGIARRLEDKYD